MALDALLNLAENQTLTASALCPNTIDQGTVQDFANGQQLFAVFTVRETFTGSGLESLYFRVTYNQDNTPALASQYAAPLLGQSSLIPLSQLVKGRRIVVALSPITNNNFIVGTPLEGDATPTAQRFIVGSVRAVNATDGVTAAPFTTGKYDLEIRTENPAGQKYYPQATSVG